MEPNNVTTDAPQVPIQSSDTPNQIIPNAPDTSGLGGLGNTNGPTMAPSISPPPDVPGNHAKLWKMLAGLSVGVSSFGTAVATRGQKGGAQEVSAYEAQQQEMALKDAANKRAQKQQELEQQEGKSRIEL